MLEINHPVYRNFYNWLEEILSILEYLTELLDESYFSFIKESLQELTFTNKGVLNLYSTSNIKIIIKLNTDIHELLLKKKLCSEDFKERWYTFIEMYYYSHAISVKAKCIQYKDNNSDEGKKKRASYIRDAKLFIDLHTSLDIFGFEIGYRSMYICDELRELCKDL